MFLALTSWGCGSGPATKTDADAAKERTKIEETAKKGEIPTGMPQDAMQKFDYPGASEAAQHGGGPTQGTQGQEKYYKK
jgi:hypothetical protein